MDLITNTIKVRNMKLKTLFVLTREGGLQEAVLKLKFFFLICTASMEIRYYERRIFWSSTIKLR